MAGRRLQAVLQYIHKVAQPLASGETTDGLLLEQFISRRDEAAFGALVRRHGPLVFTVCQRILDNVQDTEDAFQATFLVLVRRARSIAKRQSIGSWLHGVARRIAVRAKSSARRREILNRQIACHHAPDSLQEVIRRDLRVLLDEEVQRLPAHYREPFVLCYMQGKTNEEAARLLNCPKGTIDSRLSRARERLRTRLVRRGLGASAALVATMLSQSAVSATAPATLVASTTKSAVLFAAGSLAAGGLASTQAISLTQGMLKAMFLTKIKIVAAAVLMAGLTGAGAGALAFRSQAAEPEDTKKPENRKPVKVFEISEVAQGEPKRVDTFGYLQLEMAQKEYLQVVSDLRRAGVELALAKSRPMKRPMISQTEIEDAVAKDPEIAALRQSVRKFEDSVEQIKRSAKNTIAPAELERHTEALEKSKRLLLVKHDKLTEELGKRAVIKVQEEYENTIAQLSEKIEFLERLKQALKADMDQLIDQAKAAGDSEGDRIKQLEKEVRDLKALVQELKKRK
ncbi:MAG: sigma-70 family RNA polymerase sigma factor [Gemmataceae bacterium]